MLTCHFYLLSNPVWPEMFGSQIYGFIFYGQNFTLIFFTVFTMSGVGRGRTEAGAFKPPPGLLAPWLSQEVSGFSLEMMRFHGWLSPPSYI